MRALNVSHQYCRLAAFVVASFFSSIGFAQSTNAPKDTTGTVTLLDFEDDSQFDNVQLHELTTIERTDQAVQGRSAAKITYSAVPDGVRKYPAMVVKSEGLAVRDFTPYEAISLWVMNPGKQNAELSLSVWDRQGHRSFPSPSTMTIAPGRWHQVITRLVLHGIDAKDIGSVHFYQKVNRQACTLLIDNVQLLSPQAGREAAKIQLVRGNLNRASQSARMLGAEQQIQPQIAQLAQRLGRLEESVRRGGQGFDRTQRLLELAQLASASQQLTDAASISMEGRRLTLVGPQPASEWLANQEMIRKLEIVRVFDTTMGDEVFGRFEPARKLINFIASGKNLTGAGVEQLTSKALRVLFLSATSANDNALQHVGKFSRLENVRLNDTDVTGGVLKHLSGLKVLKQLNLDGTGVTNVGFEEMSKLVRLELLSLARTLVTGECLEHLQGLTELRTLDLRNTRIDDQGLSHLSRLHRLQTLRLAHTSITGSSFGDLDSLSNLVLLDLGASRVDDAALRRLGALPKLKRLELSSTRITDGSLGHVTQSARLNYLDVYGTNITDAGVAHLEDQRGLQQLYLGGTQVSDGGLGCIEELTRLTHLDLSGTQITDAGLKHLKGMNNLIILRLGNTRLTGSGIAHLTGLSKLQILDLSGTNVDDRAIASVAKLTNLRRLYLGGTRVTDAGISQMHVAKLTELHLEATAIGDGGLQSLAALANLQVINLDETNISNGGIKHLKGMTGLRSLSLNNTAITDAGLSHLGDHYRSLQLAHTRITDRGVEQLQKNDQLTNVSLAATGITDHAASLLQATPNLQQLDLSETNVTDGGLEHLTVLPELVELNLNGTRVSDIGLETLLKMPQLRQVSLENSRVTAQGASYLKHHAPGLELRLVFPWLWGGRWSYYSLPEDKQPKRQRDADTLLQQLRELTNLGFLQIDDSLLTPNVLRSLKDLSTLEHLSFKGTKLTDDMLKHLLGLSQVARLDVSNTLVTDEGLVHLKDMQGIRELNLQGTEIRGWGLGDLSQLRRLQAMHFGQTLLNDKGLTHLAKFKQLRKLELSGTHVTNTGISHLLELPRLEYLDLYGTRITDAAISHLKKLRTLRYCYLSNTGITDKGVNELVELNDLEELVLNGTGVTDEGLGFVQPLANLRRLGLGRTRVTGNGLHHVTNLPLITRINLEDLPITDADVRSLQTMSRLESLDLSGTKITENVLPTMTQFNSLTNLDLRDTAITDTAIEEFRIENGQIKVHSGITRTGYSPWSVCITITYGLVVIAICLYGIHRYWLSWLFLRDKNSSVVPDPVDHFDELPAVTVQLPMFNERHVAERIIKSACELDYPIDRLQIQVLDDSTDESGDVARRCSEMMAANGHNIQYIHRSNREGFKGGALAAGMKTATGEFIAVFDADFVPPRNILEQIIHQFTDVRIGMVQAKWSHLNRTESLLTECQAMFLDGHFVVEQSVRSRNGLWFNFNGTAGVWRKACIEEAGGWEHDTLTEDTDLSYRAQLAGWKFLYLPTVKCDAELPSTVTAFLGQQHRWTKGLIQTSKKLLPRILTSSASLRIKLEAWFHLTAPMMYLVMFLLTAIALPALFLETPLTHWHVMSLTLSLATLTLGTLAAIMFYAVSQRGQETNRVKMILIVPALMALGIGICAVNARAVLEALLGFRSPFVRTPKFGGRADVATESSRDGSRLRVPTGLLELALGGVLLGCLVLSLMRPYTLIGAPFLLLFALGYIGVGVSSLLDRYGSRSNRVPSSVSAINGPQRENKWIPSLRRFAVGTTAVMLAALVAVAMLTTAIPPDALAEDSRAPILLGLDLTTASWQIASSGRDSSSAIRRIHAERGSLVLDVHIDEMADEGEIVLNLEGAMQALGDSMSSNKQITFALHYPARFTGEFQAFAKDTQYQSEYGSFVIVESYDVRRVATVSLVPSPRVPAMGYKDSEFDLSSGIRQIGLKISAQSDRVRAAGYRPFRGIITISQIQISDISPELHPEPEIRTPGALNTLETKSAAQFFAGSGVDLPWPIGYGFSGPITDTHIDELDHTFKEFERLGHTFTRVYIGDYRTGLLFDGQGGITGVDPAFLQYVDRMAEVANQHGITVMFSLTDNTMADGKGMENVELIADPRISKQFIDNVLTRFIERLKGRQVVWDIFNEPENVTGLPLLKIQRYVDRVLLAGRAADPTARFTVVSRSRPEIVYWQGRGLDLYSHNIFTSRAVSESTSEPNLLDAPIMVAEIAPELATETNLEALRGVGYSGVGIWGLETRDKYAWKLDEIERITAPLVQMSH